MTQILENFILCNFLQISLALVTAGVGNAEFPGDLENTWTKCALTFLPVKMATAPAGLRRLCEFLSIRFMIWPVSKVLHNSNGMYTLTGQSKGFLSAHSVTLNYLAQGKYLHRLIYLTQTCSTFTNNIQAAEPAIKKAELHLVVWVRACPTLI